MTDMLISDTDYGIGVVLQAAQSCAMLGLFKSGWSDT